MEDKFRDENIDGVAGGKIDYPKGNKWFSDKSTILVLSVLALIIILLLYYNVKNKYNSSTEKVNSVLDAISKQTNIVEGDLITLNSQVDIIDSLLTNSLIKRDSTQIDTSNLLIVRDELEKKLEETRKMVLISSENLMKVREQLIDFEKSIED